MSIAAACGWTLLRSLLVALCAVPLAWSVHRQLSASSSRERRLLWVLVLVSFFTPSLLTGYAYASFSLSLIRHPGWNEVLYSALVGLRYLAVGVLVVHFAPPPPVSASAVHVARLAGRAAGSRIAQLRWLWPLLIRGPWRAVFPAAAVIFLLVFQEFEMASLMGVTSWTVWIFDAQAGGLNLERSIQSTLLPGAVQFLVLMLLVRFALQSQFLPSAAHEHPSGRSGQRTSLVWLAAFAGFMAVFVAPWLMIGRDAVSGIVPVLQNRQMLREIVVAGAAGGAAGLSAAFLAGLLLRLVTQATGAGTRRVARLTAVAVAVPGLIGSLSISLMILWLFQQPVFRVAYDTLLPVFLALIVFLIPRALLVQLVFEAVTPRSSLHIADQISRSPHKEHRAAAAELRWQLQWRRHWLAAGLLGLWGYLELTPYSILAPPGMMAAPVRLYALMHYSRSNMLSAMTMLTMLAPIAVFAAACGLRRPIQRLVAAR
ncbi:MAG: hypothetical protein AB7Q45_10125 [Planctomycetaceae bacterium]